MWGIKRALALGWSIAPNATPAELKRALLNSVTTTDSLAGKLVSGGIINVEGFLRSVVNLYGGGGQDGPLYDLGDAPESYATRLSEDGARHLATGPTLGSLRDADSTGYPSEDSRGDDMNGLDDEDGVKWSAFSIGQQNAVVTVTVRGAEDNAKLDAWIDFNHNGHWEADEQIADSVLVVNGSNQVMFDIPRTTLEGTTHSRFRLSTDGNLGVTGPAFDGEVEDYLVTIVDSRPQQIVRGSKETVLGRAGETIEFGVQYSTSDEDNTLSGLGLRLHYDSSIVTFEQLHNVYATNLVQQQGPRADTSNFDGDAATDKYVLIAWSDPFGGSWPNADLPANLFNASFKFAADLPIGTPATIHLTASSSAASHDFLGQDIHLIVAPNVSLDVDDNCRADALSDGVITLRYLFGFTGAALVEGALPPGARRTDPADIAEFLDAGRDTMLDVDGNGVADALTDGIMTFRYLFGFQGAELVQNALGAGATRTDPTEIVEFLDSFLPICPVTQSTIAAIGGGGGRSLIAGDPSQQIVIPSESQLAVTAAGDSFSFDVDYSTASPLDATLTGLGLRMHFDSDRLELQNISNVLGKNFVQQQGPLNDTSDFDGDAETDKYVLFAWSDPFGGNWPGALPATLFSPTFEATSGFTSGETRINFSASSTAAGFSFDGTTVVVSMAPENMAPTFTSFDGPIQSADEDQTVEVTFANLVAHGNEQDTDGSVQAFVVKSVVGGTLRIGADQFSATPFEAGVNDVVDAGRRAYWTPPLSLTGALDAFTVVARDDQGAESAASVTARVQVDQPVDPTKLAAISIRFADSNGNPLESVSVGQAFQIIVATQDLRETSSDQGAFGAIADLFYDTSLTDVEKVTHLSPFTIFTSGDIHDDQGHIDNVGGLDGLQQPATRAPQDIVILDAVATAAGDLLVSSAPGESPVIFNLLFGIDRDVTASTIFGEASLAIRVPEITITDVSRSEGNDGETEFQFEVSLSRAPAGTVTVDWSTGFDGTAGSDDYQDPGGRLTFTPDGPLTQTITVDVVGDHEVEANEEFEVNLSLSGGDAELVDAVGVGTIVNDDMARISVSDVEASESSGVIEFTVTLSAPASEEVTTTIEVVDGTADPRDYPQFNRSVTFRPGETTQTVTIELTDDDVVEADETIVVALSQPRLAGDIDDTKVTLGNALATGTIRNDDAAEISITDESEFERFGTLRFAISLSAPASKEVTVVANTLSDSADAGADFSALRNHIVTFAPGETEQILEVEILDDELVERDEVMTLELSNALFGDAIDLTRVTIAKPTGTGAIENDDAATINVADASRVEGHQGTAQLTFEISLSQPSAQEVTVAVSTVDGSAMAGSDYQPLHDHLVTFAPGQTRQSVSVEVVGDTLPEVAEQFGLQLSDARFAGEASSSRVEIDNARATGTILPDDAMLQIDVAFRDLQGNRLEQVTLGQKFEIVLTATDLRRDGVEQGVFGALADALFDTELIDITKVRHIAPFDQAVSGTHDEQAGIVDNAGGVQGLDQPATRAPQAFLVLEAVGVAAGRLTVQTRPGNDAVVRNLLFRIDEDVSPLTDFRSGSLQLGLADLVATGFDVESDHVLQGQTTATFTITNRGDVATDSFDVQLFLSDDAVIGSSDDGLIKTMTLPGLQPGQSTRVTVDLQLDVATLFRRAKADDPTGQGDGFISTSEEFIGLVIDAEGSERESDRTNNSNQGQGVDLDNVTYAPWDVDGDGVVSGLDAIFVLNRLGQDTQTTDGRADLDGDGIVTSLDAIAVVNRLGYLINGDVFEQSNEAASLAEGESVTEVRHNEKLPTDANGDGVTSPIDALQIINSLEGFGTPGTGYLDVNGDGEVTQADADAVIDSINDASDDRSPRNGTSVAQAVQEGGPSQLLPTPEAERRTDTASQNDTNVLPQLAAGRESIQQPAVTSATLMPPRDAVFGDGATDVAAPADELEAALNLIADDITESWDGMLA
jgi:hypothetical protein